MKKTKKWPSLILAAFTVLSFVGCEDWGQADPPAANQTYPRLEQVSKITFDDVSADEPFDPTVLSYFAYEGGEVAAIETDEELGSNVLHLPNGYARMFNPLSVSSTGVQNGVSLTFWVKQALFIDEETEEALDPDLNGALFSFQNENGTQRMYMTANGYLVYEGVDGEYSANNPEDTRTGMLLPAGEWHYMAVCIRNDGYSVHVDGYQRINMTETNFDFNKIVQFMGNTSYIYIGYGSDTPTQEMWMDDITIYRNQIGSSEQAKPGVGGGEADFHNWVISGSEDFTDGFFAVQTKLLKFKNSAHFGFYNYTDMAANWNNWVIVLTNGKAFGESGYAEHFVLRGDAYGWGDANYDGSKINSNFNWDNFTSEMNGAYVDVTLKREGNTVTMAAIVTGASGQTYTYDFTYTGELEETVGAFITGEKNYIKLDAEQVYVEGQSFTPGSYLVGPADCSAGWWSVFSENYVIEGNNEYPFGFIFTNSTNGQNNWNNWLLVGTNGIPLGGAGYAEYFVLRADAYGWGDANYSGDNISHGFNWDTFKDDMQGAYVRMFITRNGSNLSMNTITRTAAGSVLTPYTFSHNAISTDEVGVFLTAEGASLDIYTVGYFPYASEVVQ